MKDAWIWESKRRAEIDAPMWERTSHPIHSFTRKPLLRKPIQEGKCLPMRSSLQGPTSQHYWGLSLQPMNFGGTGR